MQCDLELLATGAFSPLDRFLGQRDYERVLSEMRLGNGTLWPVPVTLPLEPSAHIQIGRDVVLRNSSNEILAILSVEEMVSVGVGPGRIKSESALLDVGPTVAHEVKIVGDDIMVRLKE